MKIALAFAPGLAIDKTLPPIGIATLSAFLKAHGYQPDMFDLNLELALEVFRPDLEKEYRGAVDGMKGEAFFDPEHVAEFYHYSELNEEYVARSFYDLMRTGLAKEGRSNPLARFLHGVVQRLVSYDVVGFSLIFPYQIPGAVTLIQLLRSQNPRIRIAVGGPSTHFFEFERFADLVALGDGETQLLEYVQSLEGKASREARNSSSAVTYEKHLDDIPPPDYETLLGQYDYFCPEPILPLAITRGCYWNKCLFCDFGWGSADEGSLAIYRKMSVGKIISHMEELSRSCGTRHFFSSVDVADPVLLSQLAGRLKDLGSPFFWSSEIRAERQSAKAGFAKLLFDSGCRMLFIGMESNNQRVTDCMCKGTKPENARRLVDHAVEAGICAAAAAFVGYPGETPAEAAETQRYFHELGRRTVSAVPWSFVLTSSSKLAKLAEEGRAEAIRLNPGFSPMPRRFGSLAEFIRHLNTWELTTRKAYTKDGMSWDETSQVVLIGLVNKACDVESWFLSFPRPDSAFGQLYWSKFSPKELEERFQGVFSPWQILARLHLLFPRTMAVVRERESRYSVLTSWLGTADSTPVPQGASPKNALMSLFEMANVLCKKLELPDEELRFAKEFLRFEMNIALSCLTDDGHIPTLEARGQERRDVFGFDVGAYLSGVAPAEIPRGGRWEVAFSLSGARVVNG